jgi:hypothetical protein
VQSGSRGRSPSVAFWSGGSPTCPRDDRRRDRTSAKFAGDVEIGAAHSTNEQAFDGREPMKYLCLVYLDERRLAEVPDAECKACGDALRRSGHMIAAEALQSVHTATTVRVRGGKVSVTDGPFAETKEVLAGFYLVDATDLDQAIDIAANIPPARIGSVEVRPVRELVVDDAAPVSAVGGEPR